MTPEPTLRERWQNVDLWPTPDGPWHPVANDLTNDLTRAWDHGAEWCWQKSSHAKGDGYPHVDHGSADECMSRHATFHGRAGLDGELMPLEVFAATAFVFGEEFSDALRARQTLGTRLMLELFADEGAEEPTQRVSLTLGDALLLARHIEHTVQLVTGWAAPIQ